MAETNRAKQLEKLAVSLPGRNQKTAQAQQQARQFQLQEQVKSMQPGTGTAGLAGQMAGQQAAQAGKINLGAQQQTQQQLGQVAQLGAAEEKRGVAQKQFQQKIALSQNQREMSNKLSNINSTLNKRLLEDQLDFKQDQAGQTLLNQRQLADWAVTKAKSKEELQDYVQTLDKMYSREQQLLKTAQQRIKQVLEQGYIKEGKELNQDMKRKLYQQKAAIEKKMRDKQTEAANRKAIISGVTGVVGAVVGSYFGPAGTAAGYAAGSAIGGAASDATAE